MKIDNLTIEQKKEISRSICSEEPGFEGPETFPPCGECIVCICRKEMNYDTLSGRFKYRSNQE